LSATASDAGSGVQSVAFEYRLGSSGAFLPIGSPDTTAPYGPVSFDTTLVTDGTYQIQALATDVAGNAFADAALSVLVDNTHPTVTIGGVATNQAVSGTLLLSATAADTGGSGVASVQFGRRTSGSVGAFTNIGSALTTEPFDASFATTLVPDGRYEIQALATDVAGNTWTDSVLNVLVDNTPPNTLAKPTGVSPVSAAPTITFAPALVPDPGASASGIDHYDVYRNSGLTPVNAAPIPAGGPYTWSDAGTASNSPAVAQGTYIYRVVAVDVAGNPSGFSSGLSILLDPLSQSAPTSVTALATPTNQRPQVSWVAPVMPGFTLAHYRVYRNGAYLQNDPTTTFTDNTGGLADGSYTYQLIAADSGDVVTGVASAPVTVLYDTAAPAAPGGVAAGAALDGSIGISWAASGDGTGSGIARYVVRRSLSSTPPATTADGDATCQTTTTSCTDAVALNGKLYSYAVFAIDRAGNTSLAGNSVGVTARDQLAPAVPQGLSATPGDGIVDLRWTAAGADDDVAGYVLVAKQGGQAPTSDTDGTRVCTTIVAASTACQATGLTNGATYTFGLFALDEALNRSQPAVVSSAPNGKVSDSLAPAAVSKLKARVSGHKVTLTWQNPADHDFDHVVITAGDRKPAALKASKRVYSGKGTKALTTVAAGQSRWFVVVAYDHAGNASEPASVHVTIAAPSKFGPAPRARVHGKVKLSWPVAKGAKYYNVQVYAGKKRILVSWPNGRTLQLPRAKLKRGTTYTWYVWPGIGAKAKAHYGKLIGKNAFTFTG
jgi:fibronectin type 3 domain-containing protein